MDKEDNAKLGSEGEGENNSNNNNSDSTQQEENPNSVDERVEEGEREPTSRAARTPFTTLSQIDADLALARTLQEQERAYMMLRMEGSDYGSWDAGSYLHDEDDDFGDPNDETDEDDDEEEGHEYNETDADDDVDAFDVHVGDPGANRLVEFDPDNFSSDEAFARALQEAEEREMAERLLALAGIQEREIEDVEDHGALSQDTWEDVDPDELSYEELLALGEVVGTESRGLSADRIASLPSVKYNSASIQNGSNDSCVICRVDFEDGETLTVLSCKHSYHSECINNWLKINKVCPVCSTEVSSSGHK
ncbi:hypothetical protein K2173_006838 [Erythroxylum novogranatense]|uniref:RING-type domain-containing protein n=1 Tax=Erythroxylum novogranatense TaxID=1862640 RepID=A0AAV8SZ38_9ROSI|nr:hypothetical protein K2173_006838 [Erythroxylum novogranatense]